MDGIEVYLGLSIEYIQFGFKLYKLYLFLFIVCIRGGCIRSGEVEGRLLDDIFVDLQKFTLNVLSFQLIEVMWRVLLNLYGIIIFYDVRRDGILVYIQSFLILGQLVIIFIDYGLSLGISYLYVIIVRNRKGSVESLLVIVIIYFFFLVGLSLFVLKFLFFILI